MTSWRDLCIELGGVDCQRLLAQWPWLLKDRRLSPIAMTSFGDWFLQSESGTIHVLDVVSGQLQEVATNREEFERLAALPENLSNWFMADLVLLLREQGIQLKQGECYGFKLPPCIGGNLDPENIEATPHMVHQAVQSQILDQARKLPPGTKIRGFKVKWD